MALVSHSEIELTINGETVRAGGVPAQTTLLDFLRSQGLTGAKEGCAEGECGACTVVMVRPRNGVSAYVPVNSCLLFVAMLDGQEILTVEGLARGGTLTGAQQAIAQGGGSQCGYCTPGFVMSLFAEQYRPDREGACDPHSMGGNLCRCTGYRPIRDAALSLGPAPCDGFAERLEHPAPPVGSTSVPGFERPTTMADLWRVLQAYPDAQMVAGGTDVGVEWNLRGQRFATLISLEGLAELRQFSHTPAAVEIGAGLTLAEIDERWMDPPPVWKEWLPLFASPLIRNRATLGGNLATASPIGDGAPLLLALDTRVRMASAAGPRSVALAEFFGGYRKTALQAGEAIESLLIPKPYPPVVKFYKAAKRRLDDISTVAACFALDLDGRGRIRNVRLAYGGMAAVPLRAVEAEHAILGEIWNDHTVHRAQDVIGRTLQPMSDHRGSAEYRMALAKNLLEKFWWEGQAEEAA